MRLGLLIVCVGVIASPAFGSAEGGSACGAPPDEAVLLVRNGAFDVDISGWACSYGRLAHTLDSSWVGPGAARVTTSYSASQGHFATFGQCINLDGALADWPAVDGERKLTVEARVKTDAGIREVSLNATATAESNCGTTYLEWLSPVAIGGDQDWTRLVGTLELPEGTRSVHVFFWITASEESTGACVDEVCAYPGDPKPVEEDPPAGSSSG